MGDEGVISDISSESISALFQGLRHLSLTQKICVSMSESPVLEDQT